MSTTPQVVTVAISAPSGSPAQSIRYLSTQGFVSSSTDSPANTVFLPRLKGALEYTRSVSCWIWGNGGSSGALGTIDIDNTDGELDSWLAESWRNRVVTIRRGLATDNYDDFDHVAYAVVDRISTPDWYTIRLALRDKSALLDVSVQQSVYPALAGAPALQGTPRPICIGNCEGAELILVDDALLQYDLHDSNPFAIDQVTDSGTILTFNTQWRRSTQTGTHGVERLTNPKGKQVAQVRGQYTGTHVIERLPDVLDYLLNRSESPVSAGDVYSASVTYLDTYAPYTLCRWWHDASTFTTVLNEALDSYTGWWYFDRLGDLRVGRLEEPVRSPSSIAVELTDINLIGDVTLRLDEAPGLTDTIGAERNWSPYESGVLDGSVVAQEPARALRITGEQQTRKGINTLHPTYSQAVGGDGKKTLLSAVANAQTEADRITALYGSERYFYDCQAAIEGSLSYTLEPGDLVTLTLDRFGLDAGKTLMVVAVKTQLLSSVVSLTLWGKGPQTGDF